jgi:hypothetical protein
MRGASCCETARLAEHVDVAQRLAVTGSAVARIVSRREHHFSRLRAYPCLEDRVAQGLETLERDLADAIVILNDKNELPVSNGDWRGRRPRQRSSTRTRRPILWQEARLRHQWVLGAHLKG